jgi:hypothetical protein
VEKTIKKNELLKITKKNKNVGERENEPSQTHGSILKTKKRCLKE